MLYYCCNFSYLVSTIENLQHFKGSRPFYLGLQKEIDKATLTSIEEFMLYLIQNPLFSRMEERKRVVNLQLQAKRQENITLTKDSVDNYDIEFITVSHKTNKNTELHDARQDRLIFTLNFPPWHMNIKPWLPLRAKSSS